MNGSTGISSIVLGNPGWSGPVLAMAVLAIFWLWFSAWRSSLPFRWKWGLFALKTSALTLLAICLLDPLITRSHARPGENIIVLLADNSSSMKIRDDKDSEETRGERTRILLDLNQPWQTRLAQDFDLRRYTFGSTLTRVEGFQDLDFHAPSSNLAAALNSLKSRYQNQPLAAIFLISDGNSTDTLPADAAPSDVPIFPILEEKRPRLNDLAIANVSVSQTNFEDAPVTVQARISITGKRPKKVVVSLSQLDATDASLIQTQTIVPDPEQDPIAIFQVKPSRPGALFYELSVRNEAEPQAFETAGQTQEATLQNNRRLISINRDSHVSRILYVGGRPNWEHKFLGRALSEDHQLQLASLIRIARKEARFDFRGRVGESSNSLFRGFKPEADEETEDYSQPVLVRLNMRDGKELSDGFPKSKAELYRFDAVILDDVEAAFFTHDQQSLLDKFVSERGGGLLMLGGQASFRNGKWEHTPVADALPVYLNRSSDEVTGPLTWKLTREGWLEPWLRLRETERAEKHRLKEAPNFEIVNRIPQIKPGARLLSQVEDKQGRLVPALVVQQYGEGRAGALLVGDWWKGFMHASDATKNDPGKSWRQLARWLVGDVPQRVAVAVESSQKGGLPTKSIQIRLRNQEFQADDEKRVEVRIRQPDATEITFDAEPSIEESGRFDVEYVSRQPGQYVATVTVAGDEHDPSQSAQVGWASDPVAEEFAQTEINSSTLQKLADDSRGEIVLHSQLEEFVSNMAYRPVPVMETETIPLWHQPWILLLVLVLLACEWGLRRWRGLA